MKHQLDPHPDPELARKGWLRCVRCGREVHGTERETYETCGARDICPRCRREYPYGDPRAMVGRPCFDCEEAAR